MKVSVLVMTYNHAAYIEQALESVLAQQADFPFEVLISEDASTDGTREIVRDWQRRHPELIRLLLSPSNIRSNAVVSRGFEAARGEYVALLDGDDYWLSPAKLAKQAAFLDIHPECTICFHNARVDHEDARRASWNWTPEGHPEITELGDLLLGNFMATSSTMYRRSALNTIPAWYHDYFPITDWPLHLLHAEKGSIGYLDEVMSVYRYHAGGYYSPLSREKKWASTLQFYRRINESLGYRYDAEIRSALSKYFIEWAEELVRSGESAEARSCYLNYLRGRPVNRHISVRRMVRTGLRVLKSTARA